MINRQKTLIFAPCENKPHLQQLKTDKFILLCSRLALSLHLKYKDIQRFNEDI